MKRTGQGDVFVVCGLRHYLFINDTGFQANSISALDIDVEIARAEQIGLGIHSPGGFNTSVDHVAPFRFQ